MSDIALILKLIFRIPMNGRIGIITVYEKSLNLHADI